MKDSNLFKIKMKKINEIYDMLLDINFKLIIYELNSDNYDECILPYLNEPMIKAPQSDQFLSKKLE